MTRRRLTPDEIELWKKVAQQADRLHPDAPHGDPHRPAPKPKPHKSVQPRIAAFEVGQNRAPSHPAHRLKPSLSDQFSAAAVQMDRKAYTRMKRGKIKPEGRLDLHGMTLDRANGALVRFILNGQASGRRLVLVITGKGSKVRDDGGPIPTPRGVLKHQVPQWLSMPPLAQAVLQVTPAHVSHGGSGAYYVYLRKRG